MPRHRIKVGQALSRNLTVLGIVDAESTNPVYLVWHHRAWCPMACKLFDSMSQARREATVLRTFQHPNIVRCLGVAQPGCMLMDFLEGPTLRRLIRDTTPGRLSLSNALRVGIYLGSALIHMHSQGYLHLDVKPANVIVYRGRPVLFDVGLAERRSPKRVKYLIGTDPYMSPEQCQRLALTPASDVFGLGVTLYQALVGKRPFPDGRGRNPFPQTKIAATPLRHHLPRAPRGLDDLIQACLSRAPEERPALTRLLPALHGFITTGPKMWPAGFEPLGYGNPGSQPVSG